MKYKKSVWVKDILPLLNKIRELLNAQNFEYEICGPIRRQRRWVQNIVIVIKVPIIKIPGALVDYPGSVKFINNPKTSKGRIKCLIDDTLFVFYSATDACWGSMLLYCTGSIGFNKFMSSSAKSFGLRLTSHGLFSGETLIAGKSERQLFMALGMDYIEPHLRMTKKEWSGHRVFMRQVRRRDGEFYKKEDITRKWVK